MFSRLNTKKKNLLILCANNCSINQIDVFQIMALHSTKKQKNEVFYYRKIY